MKKRKTIVSLFAMAAAVLFAFQNPLTASAAGTTYIVHFEEGDEDWYYQIGNEWRETEDATRGLYYLRGAIKDGDVLVVDGIQGAPDIRLDVHLANLTILKDSYVVVYTNGIDDCFLHAKSQSAINGTVANAYVYDNARVNFNNNVNNLNIIGTEAQLFANVGVASTATVAHVVGDAYYGRYYEYYDVAPGALLIEDGSPRMAEGTYSTTPSAAVSQAAATTTQKTAAGEYDDVPKTGENTAVYWLLGIAVVCLAGRYALRKAA